MAEVLVEMWNYSFMRRAFVATTLLSVSLAPIGAFLVLRRLSLAGEAMAHAIMPGVVIAFVLAGMSVASLVFGGLIAGLAAASLSALLSRHSILSSDASLASLYLIGLAVGVFILSLAGSAIPLKSFLFGSILGIDDESLLLLGAVATTTLLTFTVLLRPLVSSTCDPNFFEAQSRRPWIVEQVFMVLLVLNLIASFKTLGTLMAVGLMIMPATAARYWAYTVSGYLFFCCCFALLSCWLGLIVSYLLQDVPSGPAIVLVAGSCFVLSALFGPLGLVWRKAGAASIDERQIESTTPQSWPS